MFAVRMLRDIKKNQKKALGGFVEAEEWARRSVAAWSSIGRAESAAAMGASCLLAAVLKAAGNVDEATDVCSHICSVRRKVSEFFL